MADLDRSIRIAQILLDDVSSENDPDCPMVLNSLSFMLHSRYERTGRIEDLIEAILREQRAVELAPTNDPQFPAYLNNLGSFLFVRFQRLGRIEDLNEAILRFRQVETTLQTVDPTNGAYLTNLRNCLLRSFEETGKVADLDESIQKAQQITDALSPRDPKLPDSLSELSSVLYRRFTEIGNVEDLKKSICKAKQSLNITPGAHPSLADRKHNLGARLLKLFTITKNLNDLEEAILVTQEALNVTADHSEGFAESLNSLGFMILKRYQISGNEQDLEVSISTIRRATEICRKDDPRLALYLSNLGEGLRVRYLRTHNVEDLDEWIGKARQAVNLTTEADSILAGRLNHLGQVFVLRFETTGKIGDLNDSIQNFQEAVKKTPEDNQEYHTYLSCVGDALSSRYNTLGELSDLEKSIAAAQDAVDHTPSHHPHFVTRLTKLGKLYAHRYEHVGNLDDLARSISRLQQAINIGAESDPVPSTALQYLSIALAMRFDRMGRMEDLDESIRYARTFVDGAVKTGSNLAGSWANLGNLLLKKYERTRNKDDLDTAISHGKKAKELMPESNPSFVGILHNLARMLARRFDISRQAVDLSEAICFARRAANTMPVHSQRAALFLHTLAVIIQRQFTETGGLEQLKEAISTGQRALNVITPEDPNLAVLLNDLGQFLCLSIRSHHHDKALTYFRQSLNCVNGNPFIRVDSALRAIQLLKRRCLWLEALTLVKQAIDILPLITNRSLGYNDQAYAASIFSGLAENACSLSLQVGAEACESSALELLELSRGTIIGLLMDSRTDLFDLEHFYPGKAADFVRLRDEVNLPHEADENAITRRAATARRLSAVQELEDCIKSIRALPGYQRFLLGASREELTRCAADGPIIVVNVTDIRSDAIVVNTSGVKSVALPSMTYPEIEIWTREGLTQVSPTETPQGRGKKNKRYIEFLKWLWLKCVQPILLEVYQGQRPAFDDLHRIWWIGVGVASSLPFHAAGDHSVNSTENTLSWAISSYTPTIKALAHAKAKRTDGSQIRNTKPALLLVAMPNTPGEETLPGVMKEVSIIQSVTESVISSTILSNPNARTVLQSLQQYDLVHFACHGISDLNDPFNSCVLLEDNTGIVPTVDKLTVRQIWETQSPRATTAFLSACSTAENRDVNLMDEVIHLASGFQVAGFRHVVASMWATNDEVCVNMAEGFYRRIKGQTASPEADRSVAEAVHNSILQIRSNLRKTPLNWAPYIHFGA